jgi:hypothetical protein
MEAINKNMKRIILIVILVIVNSTLHAQMNKNDSSMVINLWNGIYWHFSIENYPKLSKYSNDTYYLELILNDEGKIIIGKTYYFDGTIAMQSKLFSNPGKLTSQDPSDMDFEQINYYPNGKVRMVKYNFSNTKLEIYYNENQEVFQTNHKVNNDTLCGIFPSNFDEDYNLTFKVYEHGSYIGNIVLDEHLKRVKSNKDIPIEIIEEKYAILMETFNNPYSLK